MGIAKYSFSKGINCWFSPERINQIPTKKKRKQKTKKMSMKMKMLLMQMCAIQQKYFGTVWTPIKVSYRKSMLALNSNGTRYAMQL